MNGSGYTVLVLVLTRSARLASIAAVSLGKCIGTRGAAGGAAARGASGKRARQAGSAPLGEIVGVYRAEEARLAVHDIKLRDRELLAYFPRDKVEVVADNGFR